MIAIHKPTMLTIKTCTRHLKANRRWLAITVCMILTALVMQSICNTLISSSRTQQLHHDSLSKIRVLSPAKDPTSKGHNKYDPEKWLRDHSDMTHFETGNEWFNDRPKAAIISLVRNDELEGILQSMRQLERHWNRRYQYPWLFFSEKEFSEEFKARCPTLPYLYFTTIMQPCHSSVPCKTRQDLY